jgi:hypothetical protein
MDTFLCRVTLKQSDSTVGNEVEAQGAASQATKKNGYRAHRILAGMSENDLKAG